MSTKNKTSDGASKGKVTESLWTRAFTVDTEWTDKEEFLDVIYWMRQIIGIVLGLCWGIIPLKGFIGILLFFIVNTGVIYFYINTYQKIDEDEYDGLWEIYKEGLMTATAGFLVTWIIFYTGLYGNESLL